MTNSNRERTTTGMAWAGLEKDKDAELKVLKGVIENSRDVISAVSPDFRYIAFNSAYKGDFKRVFGREVKLGASVDELLPDLPQREIAKAFWKRALAGESFTVRQEFGDETRGERNYFDIYYRPVRDEGGKVIAVSTIAHNVTCSERTEQELRRLKDELEERVRLRTRELEKSSERLRLQVEERKKTEEALTTARKTAENRAREAEEGHRILFSIMRCINEGIAVADAPDGTMRMVSDYGLELLGRSEKEVVGIPSETRPERWGIYKKDATTLAKPDELPLSRSLKSGETIAGEEWLIRRPDGNVRNFEFSSAPITDNRNNIVGAVSDWRDITERKKAEEELRRMTKVLTAASDSRNAIIHAKDERSYLEAICQIIVKDTGYSMVWIGYAENDADKTVRPVAYAGFEKGYLETLRITWSDTERGRGPTGTAIRTGEISASKNIRTDPRFKPWLEEARKRGYESSIVFPLKENGKVFGALTIYATRPESFSEDEVQLFSSLATDISFGIIALRSRIERDKAEVALRQSDRIIRNVNSIILNTDHDGNITYINDFGAKYFGYSKDELIGKGVVGSIVPKTETTSRDLQAMVDAIMKNPENYQTNVNENIRKNGERVWITWSNKPILDDKRKLLGVFTVGNDITELVRAEETLRRNEYELRTLVDNSPDLIFRLNRQLQYIYVNPAYERITGLTREQFIGKSNDQLGMTQQMVEFWQSATKNVIENGREHSAEFDMSSFFGKRYFFARIIPEFAKSGLVETVLVIARDITERKRAEEQLRYISFHDEVTGLFNRAFFEEEIRRVDTERELPISIIMGDVNNLKLSNDVFGHNEGDRLLKTIADIFRKACRKNDIIARWGGDEFVVILPRTPPDVANGVCDRVKQIAQETRETVILPSIALGIATKEQKDQSIYQTIRQAEERMYQNKLDESRQNEDGVYESLFKRVRERTKDYDPHVKRSLALADTFGKALKLSENEFDDLQLLIKLHDIGDAVIPREILTKPGRLNGEEWSSIKKHSEAGFRIVKTFADTARISGEVFAHSEYWNGSGYPRGLKEHQIPYLARVFLIIDAFDVITHTRPYARVFTQEEAVEELSRNTGKQFDPELTEAFINMLTKESAAATR